MLAAGTLALLVVACAKPPFRGTLETGAATTGGPVSLAPPEQATVGPGSRARTPGGFYPGTGRTVGTVSPAPGQAPITTMPSGELTLNFVDADLREVIQAILGDTLNANYIVDPAVQGTVTMQTSRPLPPSALLTTLEDILSLNGATLLQSEGVYKIVPADRAVSGGAGASVVQPSGRPTTGTSTTIVPLRYVSVSEMQKILEPLAPGGAVLNVDPTRNVIVLGGDRSTRANLLDVIEAFDVDWLQGTSFALYPVHSAEAATLAAELEAIFGAEAEGGGSMVRFVPIERLNAILAISPNREYLRRVGTWVTRLDAGEEEVQRIFVYYVENARAAELAEILGEIFSPGETTGVSRPDLAPGLQPTELTGEGGGEQVRSASTPTAVGSEGVRTGAQGPIRIIADPARNALVILATPRDYRLVQSALRQLDIIPLQVLIEATIAEVRLTNELRYGLEWFFRTGNSSFTLNNLGTTAISSVFPGFSYVLSAGSVDVILNALEQVTNVNVISSPSVSVLDNQTASLLVGDQVPILTQQSQSTVANAPIVNSVEYRDTGIELNVTPRVNAGGLVTMEIDQSVSDVVQTDTSTIDSPTIQQRQIQSTVAVQDGETIALGGLIEDSNQEGSSGVPLLSNIPILGFLFGRQTDRAERTELLVFLTPRVIRNQAEARRITDELRFRLRSLTPLETRIR